MTPPLHRHEVTALHAVAESPGGLRLSAYPLAMPGLVARGLVVAVPRPRGRPGERVWRLTAAGRRAQATAALEMEG